MPLSFITIPGWNVVPVSRVLEENPNLSKENIFCSCLPFDTCGFVPVLLALLADVYQCHRGIPQLYSPLSASSYKRHVHHDIVQNRWVPITTTFMKFRLLNCRPTCGFSWAASLPLGGPLRRVLHLCLCRHRNLAKCQHCSPPCEISVEII